MSENGSQASLVSKNLFDAYQSYPIAEPVLSKTLTSKSRRKEKKETNWRVGILFIIFLSCLFMFVMICIGAVYIQQLQDNMQRLEQRVRVLENSVKDRPCKREESIMNTKVKARTRRDINSVEESNHIMSEHHGIASHRIAYIFGDPAKVGVTDDSVSADLRFSPSSRHGVGCDVGFKKLFNVRLGDYLCKKRHRSQSDKMMFTQANHFYNYFAKASWMNYTNNFDLHSDGRLSVKKTGMYIVHASMHFSDLKNGDLPHYGVYKTDSKGFNKKLISKCVVTMTEDVDEEIMGVYPCQAWQLVGLNAGDLVYLRIGGYTWFRIEKETFHLALIRLNQESV